MIDRVARDQLAEALRRLLSGRMDNLAFDDLALSEDSADPALFHIFYAVWPCYDDFRSHPLRLTEGQRLDFLRCVVFLHTDFEYEWPDPEWGIVNRIRRIADALTCRRFGWWPRPELGEMFVWPFFRREDYAQALKHPRLLSGRARTDRSRVGVAAAR